MINKIKKIANTEDKKRLISNFLSLFLLKGINYILPLITFPYLVRILGAEKFGLLSFAGATISYFNILTDYGFNLTATKEVSIYRDNKEKLNEIFSSVMIIKFILMLISFLLLLILILNFEKFQKDYLVYILTFGMVIGQVLFPQWFFQGIEKMKYITFLNILARSIFTIAIFIFIHKESDYWKVPLINSMGFIFSGFLSLWIILKIFKIKLIFPKISIIWNILKYSTEFFVSRVFVSIYTISNTFIIGLLFNNQMVGFYAAAEKIFLILIGLYQPLVDVLYPYMSRKKDIKFFKRIFYKVIIFNFILWILVFLFSDEIIEIFYGKGFIFSIQLLKYFSILGLIMVPAIMIGYPFVAALGYPKYANYSVVIASIIHLILLISLILCCHFVNIYLIVVITIISQLFVLFIRIYGIKKYNLWRI